ncbi:microcystin-dependent protein [Chitinophaga skermanii]|uniref:Microcystin-dependent protein n=1 Tax=Chitinophaga skermanii TaxID=331697 RepID=A0A327Q0W4_9BACT|nr:tail fiber protein [Chitinophaga skermanii]RAI97534.1 microcystin-dependent protein [Chitinophaga skermanii]
MFAGTDEYLGTIIAMAGTFAPAGTLMANGGTAEISWNEALYTLMGIKFGGNGANTFGLPDLRGRVPLGMGTTLFGETYNWGDQGGTATVTLLTSQLPTHTHALSDAFISIQQPVANTNGVTNNPTNYVHAIGVSTVELGYKPYNTEASVSQGVKMKLKSDGITNIAGSSMPHPNMMPYNTITYCVISEGIYPSQY